MGGAISADCRLRTARGISAGKSRRAVAERFEVAPPPAARVQARYAATGSVEPAKQGRPKGSGKPDPYRAARIEKVKARPDIAMPDLAVWLEAEHGIAAGPSNLSKRLCEAGFTYKKRRRPRRRSALTPKRRAGDGLTVANPSCAASRRGSSSSAGPA